MQDFLTRVFYSYHDNHSSVEIGTLSVTKTELKNIETTQGRHGRILAAVNRAAEQLVISSRWQGFVEEMISEIGAVINASCNRVVKNHSDPDGNILASQKFQWFSDGLSPPDKELLLENLSYKAIYLNLS